MSLDIKQQALLMPVSSGQENMAGINNLYNSTGVVKALALLESVSNDLKMLVKECLLQLGTPDHAPLGLIARILADTVDPINPRILASLLISDLELYQDLHLLIDYIKNYQA